MRGCWYEEGTCCQSCLFYLVSFLGRVCFYATKGASQKASSLQIYQRKDLEVCVEYVRLKIESKTIETRVYPRHCVRDTPKSLSWATNISVD